MAALFLNILEGHVQEVLAQDAPGDLVTTLTVVAHQAIEGVELQVLHCVQISDFRSIHYYLFKIFLLFWLA